MGSILLVRQHLERAPCDPAPLNSNPPPSFSPVEQSCSEQGCSTQIHLTTATAILCLPTLHPILAFKQEHALMSSKVPSPNGCLQMTYNQLVNGSATVKPLNHRARFIKVHHFSVYLPFRRDQNNPLCRCAN